MGLSASFASFSASPPPISGSRGLPSSVSARQQRGESRVTHYQTAVGIDRRAPIAASLSILAPAFGSAFAPLRTSFCSISRRRSSCFVPPLILRCVALCAAFYSALRYALRRLSLCVALRFVQPLTLRCATLSRRFSFRIAPQFPVTFRRRSARICHSQPPRRPPFRRALR